MIPKCGNAFDMSNFDEYEDQRVKGVKGDLTQAEQDTFQGFWARVEMYSLSVTSMSFDI